MKKVLVVLAVLAVASSAMAVPTLTAMPKVTNRLDTLVQVGTMPTSITPDGAYVGGIAGLGFSGSGEDTGFVYDVANNVAGQVVAGGYQASVNGIGYQYPTAGGKQIVVGGDNGGYQSMNTWDTATTWNGTANWTKVRRANTSTTNEYRNGGKNTVAGTGGPRAYSTYQGNAGEPLYVDNTENGVWGLRGEKGTTSGNPGVIHGVSSTGVAVGYRGGNYVLTYNGTAGLLVANVNGLTGTTQGELWDIADNGTIAGGASYKTGDSRWFAYVRKMSDGSVYALPSLGGPATDLVTVSRVYGISPDGNWAVGMDYSYGMEKAALWNVSDLNNITAIDLTQYAIDNQIIGSFDGNLRRAYAMGIDAQGNPVVTGIGFAGALEANGWTGFVMTVPEPTTVLFLAIGGLAMLRRRH